MQEPWSRKLDFGVVQVAHTLMVIATRMSLCTRASLAAFQLIFRLAASSMGFNCLKL